ncbi:hypothetical protein [Amycolatopsis kentuckyensis]|uniref:hypothetical protein n=1 Tax=Amycolatopsis kentuckyensis TaxID=218823 RepID=UPI0035699AA5
MRLSVVVLGTELFSIELCGSASDVDEETGPASGGQFELGFRPPRPSWSVDLPSEDPD